MENRCWNVKGIWNMICVKKINIDKCKYLSFTIIRILKLEKPFNSQRLPTNGIGTKVDIHNEMMY